jgi:uncharacterized protein (TIGR00297 family)
VSPTLAIFAARLAWTTVVIPVAFGAIAWLLRGVTVGGAIAGTACAFLIYWGLGPGGFAALMAVFAVTWLCTRLGSAKKQRLGLAQDKKGRTAGQVLANVGVAAVCAALSPKIPFFAAASIAAMAEAAADTSQSEIGEIASSRSWLITSFREVPPGTDGGITLPGTLAGATAVSIVAGVAFGTGILPAAVCLIAAISGFLGTVVDSLLGATLERRGILNNNAVNFLSTMAAAAIALGLGAFNNQ